MEQNNIKGILTKEQKQIQKLKKVIKKQRNKIAFLEQLLDISFLSINS
ncbi:hypothetical protein [Mycoplasma sp. 392]